jgi:tetratricopeptide (TPR) repeat protein
MILSNPRPELDEAFALLDLGLNEEALAVIESQLATDPCREVHAAAVAIFNRLGHFTRAARCADELLRHGTACTPTDRELASRAYNFAGRIREAYDIERATQPFCNDTSLVRLYGLACKASRLGLFQEALSHMLSCFRFENLERWDAHRKIFLDSELADLWEQIPALTISLRDAMRFCNLPFDEILQANENTHPLRCVDHMDLRSMPPRFRKLLQPVHETCFEVSPLKQAAHPRIYSDYVKWQQSLIAPRLQIFRDLAARIRRTAIEHQLAFAKFQATRGRIACARNHLVCHLQNTPGSSFDDLPDIPELRGLVAEFRAQHAESPESFAYLISWRCKEEPENFLFDIHPEMPLCNRNSGYALLALGCMHYRLGNVHSAIEHWAECAKIWPLDDAPVMNATMLLSGEERWEEADELIQRLPGQCMESTLWKNACTAIRERRSFTISNKTFTTPVIPTPTGGGLYSGADEEFLLETKKFTVACY